MSPRDSKLKNENSTESRTEIAEETQGMCICGLIRENMFHWICWILDSHKDTPVVETLDPDLSPEEVQSKCIEVSHDVICHVLSNCDSKVMEENALLRREISTLHDEVTSFSTRVRYN